MTWTDSVEEEVEVGGRSTRVESRGSMAVRTAMLVR